MTRNGANPAPTRKRGAPATTIGGALGVVTASIGDLCQDEVLLLDTRGGRSTVQTGDRATLLADLVADRVVDDHARHFLSHAAPCGWVWVVAELPDGAHAILVSTDVQPSAQGRVSLAGGM